MTEQEQDPETGRYVRKPIPESEWLKMEMPNLGIVSDELRTTVEDKFGVPRLVSGLNDWVARAAQRAVGRICFLVFFGAGAAVRM